MLPIQHGQPPCPCRRQYAVGVGHESRAEVGLAQLFVKDDGRNPSGSLKDRASAIAVAGAREAGRTVVATASTGNAAAALAALGASAGQANVIFVPRTAPPAKLAQILVYGSRVLAIDGSYDQAFDLCIEACAEFGWYNRNTGYNPYMTEGKKTVAYEIAAQLAAHGAGQWVRGHRHRLSRPMRFLSPSATAVFLAAYTKGLRIWSRWAGLRRCHVFMACSPWQRCALLRVEDGHASARTGEGVDARGQHQRGRPADAIKALAAVRESEGAFLAVDDDAFLEAILPLARVRRRCSPSRPASRLGRMAQALASGLVPRRDHRGDQHGQWVERCAGRDPGRRECACD